MAVSRARRSVRRVGLLVLCVTALLTGCTGGSARPGDSPTAPAPTVAGQLQRGYQRVVDDVLPSVVQITTERDLGSGVVYDDEGHIVTNAHVVGRSTSFEVTLATGGDPLDAHLVARYPDQDLAVIRLADPPPEGGPPANLRPAVLGDSRKVEVGQIVLAMGNPLGLSSSVTQGIVSAVGRSVSAGRGQSSTATIGNMVQTSAAINPGNSGGALVNLSGQVIGIPTLGARDPRFGSAPAPGIGFAIPAATVRRLADQMIEHGEVVDPQKAALGVTVRTVLGDDFEPAGASVVEVASGGPAARAGIRAGDVLVRIGREPVTDVVTLAEVLAGHQPGDEVTVRYERGGDRRSARVTLGEA